MGPKIKRKPYLIIDLGEHSIFSLLVDETGAAHPCTQEINGQVLKYFLGKLYLNSSIYIHMQDQSALEIINSMACREQNFARLGKKLGWLRTLHAGIDEKAIPVKNLIKILSSPILSERGNMQTLLPGIIMSILEYLLDPILRFVKISGTKLDTLVAFAIIPDYYGQKFRLFLQKILRKHHVKKTLIVPRESAAVMNALASSHTFNATVIESDHTDSICYGVEIKRSPELVQLICPKVETLEGLGWDLLVNLLSKERRGIHRSDIERSLLKLGLGYASNGSRFKITHSMVDELFIGSKRKLIDIPCVSKLRDCIKSYSGGNTTVIPLGLVFMIGGFENEMLANLNIEKQSPMMKYRSLERSAYGLAIGLDWLTRNPGQKIGFANRNGIRIAISTGESMELVSHEALPLTPGAKKTYRRVLDFYLGEGIRKGQLNFSFLWGMNPKAEYNSMLAFASLLINAEDRKKQNKIWVTIDLQRIKTGNGILGSAKVFLGNRHEFVKFSIDRLALEISIKDIRE